MAADPSAPPGSPDWWATRPVPPAAPDGPRRGRPALDTGRVIDTALRLVDEHGTQAFSLRMLADALGSGTATLYRHFAGKDEIMAYVVDRVLGEADLTDLSGAADLEAGAGSGLDAGRDAGSGPGGPRPGATWQGTLTATAHRLYATLRRHPDVLPLLMAQVPVGPHGLAQRERVLGALLGHGLPVGLAARAFTAVGHYVIGFAAQQHGHGAAPDNGPQLAAFYGRLDPAAYPALAEAAPALTSVPVDEEFRFGLALLVHGLEQLHPAPAPLPPTE
nr:TetR/AcrR family transcriptional regulator [Streptomyces sp. NBC_00974]